MCNPFRKSVVHRRPDSSLFIKITVLLKLSAFMENQLKNQQGLPQMNQLSYCLYFFSKKPPTNVFILPEYGSCNHNNEQCIKQHTAIIIIINNKIIILILIILLRDVHES